MCECVCVCGVSVCRTSLRQVNSHSAPYEGTTNGAVTQGRGTLSTTTEMSARQEENFCLIIHTDFAQKALMF